jgi:hypothetical protein
MRQLQPCLDDFRCKEIMGRDFGGKTILVRAIASTDGNVLKTCLQEARELRRHFLLP